MPDDEQLYAAWRAGDAAAFGDLYRRHAGTLKGYCRRILGRAEVAEEVVVDTFERVARGRWKPTGSFRSFLYTVAHRRCMDLLRRRKTRARAAPALRVVTDEAPRPDDRVELRDDVRRLEAALAQIPEANRAAILLYYHEHLSVKEVAEVTACTTEQVKSRLAYGRRLLRQHLGAP